MKGMKRANIIPTMKYHDAPAAIEWLCRAFGFEKQMVVEGEGGRIDHAQLKLGDAMIMLGSFRGNEYEKRVRTPQDVGGFCTQSAYLVIDDVDAMYASAKAAGAEIYQELQEPDYGGKFFGCVDPEGQIWNFGSYDPWA
ncbi:MAG: VOC family protein [Bryobacterales bacterium]